MLFVITPTEVVIYDCFRAPFNSESGTIDDKGYLVDRLDIYLDAEKMMQKLKRWNFDTGEVWETYKSHFNSNERVDIVLLEKLRVLRTHLTRSNLSIHLANSLIGWIIFVMYLQDRGALTDFYAHFKKGKYANFDEVLSSAEDVFELISELKTRFDGDIFPITSEERRTVNTTHFLKLRDFIRGTDLNTAQTALWPYNFNVIPIEFISSVYEEFLHSSGGPSIENEAPHYTPSYLVDFLVDQVLPENFSNSSKVLDPSCGSGIFLVSVYRRLIAMSANLNGSKDPNVKELKSLLTHCIYGVDINKEAIRVAAFSLYLTLIDYLEPKSILLHENLFPRLIGTNLFESDFFDTSQDFDKKRYDLIVGNTPWISKLTKYASSYLRNRESAVGDSQISQAFLLKTLEVTKERAKVCLITSAKGLLFNIHPKSRKFREEFFREAKVETIFNFASLRSHLFKKAQGPSAAVIFSSKMHRVSQPTDDGFNDNQLESYITYVCPKPSPLGEKLGSIVIEQSDVSEIPFNLATDGVAIWKNAMWATPQDWKLINKLRKRTIREVIKERSMHSGEGFQPKGRTETPEWMTNLYFIPTKAIGSFKLDLDKIRKFQDKTIHRSRPESRYKGPLSIIKTAPQGGRIVSAFYEKDLCFKETAASITGSTKDVPVLKAITCIMNSKLASYYLFLTASSWGVERDSIKMEELRGIPFPSPKSFEKFGEQIVELHDLIISGSESTGENDYLKALDDLIYDAFELTPTERVMIDEFLTYGLTLFQNKDKSVALRPANDELVHSYANIFKRTIDSLIEGSGKTVSAVMYTGNRDLYVASFELASSLRMGDIYIKNDEETINKVLTRLHSVLKQEMSENVYFSRFLKIYELHKVHLIRPSESRLWTTSHAYSDVEDVIGDILSSWGDVS